MTDRSPTHGPWQGLDFDPTRDLTRTAELCPEGWLEVHWFHAPIDGMALHIERIFGVSSQVIAEAGLDEPIDDYGPTDYGCEAWPIGRMFIARLSWERDEFGGAWDVELLRGAAGELAFADPLPLDHADPGDQTPNGVEIVEPATGPVPRPPEVSAAVEQAKAVLATVEPRAALITCDPKIRGGWPCVAGTRIGVEHVAGRIKGGEETEAIAADYEITIEQVRAAVDVHAALQYLFEDGATFERAKSYVAPAWPGTLRAVAAGGDRSAASPTEITHDLAELTHRLRTLGPELRKLREASAIGLGQLARALGVHVPTLSRFELGEGQPLAPVRDEDSLVLEARRMTVEWLRWRGHSDLATALENGRDVEDHLAGRVGQPEEDTLRITASASGGLEVRGNREIADALGFKLTSDVAPVVSDQAMRDVAAVQARRDIEAGLDPDPCPICGSNMLEDGFCLACEDLNREEGEEL